MKRRGGSSITEILSILAGLAILVAVISYGMGWLGSGNKQANKLSEGSQQLLENTVDKMTAETFLNSLTFIWDIYDTNSTKKVSSSSGSWNDLVAKVNNLANNKYITPVVVYVNTTDPTSGGYSPVSSGNIGLEPYKSLSPKPDKLPFGYSVFYNILKKNPNVNIYFVVGLPTDKYQIVVQSVNYETS